MKKILVVDDERKVRKVYSELLASEGYEVISVSNAVEANEILEKVSIDLVLLDINMPEIDGSLTYQIIDMFYKKTKVIVCSVRSLEDQHKIIEGAKDYYDKSQGISVLRNKVRRIFENGREEKDTRC